VHNAIDIKTQQYAPKFVIVHDRENLQSKEASQFHEQQRNRMIPKLMKEALQKNPKDQRALFNLSNWYMTMLDFNLALKFYKLCLKQTPTHDERYFVQAQIGIANLLLGHNLRALFAFFDLEKLIPDRWETKRLIAGVYMQKGMYKKAVTYLTFALEPNKFSYLYSLFGHDLAELWDLIGSCYQSMNEPERAVIAWNEAIKNTTDDKRKGFFATKRSLAMMLSKNPNAEITLEEVEKITNS
jgi:tetratricopeptide (TPR) repeat protein